MNRKYYCSIRSRQDRIGSWKRQEASSACEGAKRDGETLMTDSALREALNTTTGPAFWPLIKEYDKRKAQAVAKYRIVVDGDEIPGEYDTLDAALGAVAFDRLEMYQIWNGNVLVVDHD